MKARLLSIAALSFLMAEEPPFPTTATVEPTPYSRDELEKHRSELESERQKRSDAIIAKSRELYTDAGTDKTASDEEKPQEPKGVPPKPEEKVPPKKKAETPPQPSQKPAEEAPKSHTKPFALNVNVPNAAEERSYEENPSNVNTKVMRGMLTVEIENSREGDVALEVINRCKTPYPTTFVTYKKNGE